jgi:hypothetical protein
MRRKTFVILIFALLSLSAAHGSPKTSAKHKRSVASASHRRAHHASARESRAASAHARKGSRREEAHRSQVRSASLHRSRRAARLRLEADYDVSGRVPSAEEASPSESQPATPTLRGASSPLRGSLESLVRQNDKTQADGLERIEDDEDLNDRIARGMLQPVPVSPSLAINANLPENRRYCRPWTARFLSDLGRDHAAIFHHPIVVSSAVRTVEYQQRLERVNGNAAAAEGEVASPHLTGAAIDIAKQGMSREELAWMRAHLLPLQNSGKIDVEEEFHQACFHITVYKSYLPPTAPRKASTQASAALNIGKPGM